MNETPRTEQIEPETGRSLLKDRYIQEFESLPLAATLDQFFDTIESWGLPVIAMFGTSRSGKSSLLETFPPENLHSSRDALTQVMRGFINVRGLRQKGNDAVGSLATVHFGSDEYHHEPLLAYARAEPIPDPYGNWLAWWADVSAMLLMRRYLYGRLPDIDVDETDFEKTTQFLVAHRCSFDRAPGHPFVLLDLPGELMAPEREDIATVARQRLPRIVTAAVFVESFMTLYPDDNDLQFRLGSRTLTTSQMGEVFGLPELEDYTKFRNASPWWTAFGRTRNQFSTIPTPLLSVITKFDYLENGNVLDIEYTGDTPGSRSALAAFLNRKDALVANLASSGSPADDLGDFNRHFRELLSAATRLIDAFKGNTNMLLWAGLLDQAHQKPLRLAHSAFLSHVPVQCHVVEQDGSTRRCDHGAALVRWWIFDRVFSWYESREGLFG